MNNATPSIDYLGLAYEAYEDAKAANVPVADWDQILWDFEAGNMGRTWGKCRRFREFGGNMFKILLSNALCLHTNPNAILNTIIHELVHTAGSFGHGRLFKQYAAQINRMFPGKYHVSRCNTAAEKGMSEEEQLAAWKYAIQCPKCGHIWHYDRCSKAVRHPELYWCTTCSTKENRVRLKRIK